jgi:hypothetical protein
MPQGWGTGPGLSETNSRSTQTGRTESGESEFRSNPSGTKTLEFENPEFVVSMPDHNLSTSAKENFFVAEYVYAQQWSAFCFENNNPCRRASSGVRAQVGNNPVVLQAFTLNLAKNTTQANTIEGATVTTAELDFDSSGNMVLGTPVTKIVAGQGCDLSHKNSVGVAASNSVLSSLYFLETGTWSSSLGVWQDARATSVRVWYSGILPPETSATSYNFVPTGAAASIDFGLEAFTDLTPANGVDIVGRFGWVGTEPNLPPNSADHVIVGWCLNGTKTVNGQPRPLVLKASSRRYTLKIYGSD